MNNSINTSNTDDVFDILATLPHPVREELFVELALKGYFSIEYLPVLPWLVDIDKPNEKSMQRRVTSKN